MNEAGASTQAKHAKEAPASNRFQSLVASARMKTPEWKPSARTRILGWYVLLLACALVTALLIQRSYLLRHVVTDADLALAQEVDELRQVAGGIDPATGEPFAGDVAAIFDFFLDHNVPHADEGVVTVVDGVPYKHDSGGRVFVGTELLDHWSSLTVARRDQVDTDEGRVRYLAVPLENDEGTAAGVFVAVVFLDEALARVNDVVRVGGLVLGSIFILASVVAWIAAGEVLRPVRLVTETARTITESDLSERIPAEGEDEVADLARTFNSMLDRLEESFSTQRQFVDDAGHELRTPITVIRGQLELLGDDPEDRDATIAMVTGELDRMSRIVEELLTLARSEQPDFIKTHPFDLDQFIDDLAVMASSLSDSDVLVASAQPAVIVGDQQRLTQAMMNLVDNAFSHGPAGVAVAIGGSTNSTTARLWVADNGPGIPPEVESKLFERFYRGKQGKRTTPGAGLGLSIVQAIAEGHNGRVEVETGEAGTTFTLVLPVGISEDGKQI